jgi:DNA mismatch endonuclease (patch repair protein)
VLHARSDPGQKIEMNRRRDEDTDETLRENGWQVIRVWEHDDPGEIASRVLEELHRRGEATRASRLGH